MNKTKEQVIEDVFAELKRAQSLHPDWPSDRFMQLAIIGEEFGEAQQAALHMRFGTTTPDNYYKELVQVAAMALRALFDEAKGAANE